MVWGAGAGEHHVLYCRLQGAALSLGRGQRKRSEKREEERERRTLISEKSQFAVMPGMVCLSLLYYCSSTACPSTEGRRATRFATQSEGASKHNIAGSLTPSASFLCSGSLLYSHSSFVFLLLSLVQGCRPLSRLTSFLGYYLEH